MNPEKPNPTSPRKEWVPKSVKKMLIGFSALLGSDAATVDKPVPPEEKIVETQKRDERDRAESAAKIAELRRQMDLPAAASPQEPDNAQSKDGEFKGYQGKEEFKEYLSKDVDRRLEEARTKYSEMAELLEKAIGGYRAAVIESGYGNEPSFIVYETGGADIKGKDVIDERVKSVTDITIEEDGTYTVGSISPYDNDVNIEDPQALKKALEQKAEMKDMWDKFNNDKISNDEFKEYILAHGYHPPSETG